MASEGIVSIKTNENIFQMANLSEIIKLLQDFIEEVVTEQPDDIVDFAAVYFNTLKEKNTNAKTQYTTGSLQNKFGLQSLNTSKPSALLSTESIRACKTCTSPPFGSSRLLNRRNSIAGEPYVSSTDSITDNREIDIVYPKSQKTRKRVENIIKEIFIFKSCSPDQIEKLIDAMYEREVFNKEIIIQQGDQGDNFFVSDTGKFDVWFRCGGNDDSGKQKIGCLEAPCSFGELALMYNCPRSASVVAVENGTVWVLDRSTFKRILFTTTEKKRRQYEELLENIPILSLLTAYERTTLADALDTIVFQDNACIITEGDSADCMYFIEDGRVKITVQNTKKDDNSKTVFYAERGDYFGELALVYKTKRLASVQAEGKVTCAYLDLSVFERLLGPCQELMKRNAAKYDKKPA